MDWMVWQADRGENPPASPWILKETTILYRIWNSIDNRRSMKESQPGLINDWLAQILTEFGPAVQ